MFKKVSIPPEHGRDIRPIHRIGTRDVRQLELTEFNNTWPDGATMMPSPPSRILHTTTWVVSAMAVTIRGKGEHTNSRRWEDSTLGVGERLSLTT